MRILKVVASDFPVLDGEALDHTCRETSKPNMKCPHPLHTCVPCKLTGIQQTWLIVGTVLQIVLASFQTKDFQLGKMKFDPPKKSTEIGEENVKCRLQRILPNVQRISRVPT
jgi:hypothetical protein